jgi:hypothetical protein
MWRDEFLSKTMDALSTMDRNPKGTPCLARAKAPNLSPATNAKLESANYLATQTKQCD